MGQSSDEVLHRDHTCRLFSFYLQRGSRQRLVGGTTKSAGRAVAAIYPSPISLDMKMNTPAIRPGEEHSYVPLQHQIHDALREQHPEWIGQNGDCPTCESYESRFAELLNGFLSTERKSAA
jgi:hypothetical protein